MKKLEITRLEAHVDILCANKDEADEETAFSKYCLEKLKEAGFDMTKDIDYTDEIHTITFTQEDDLCN